MNVQVNINIFYRAYGTTEWVDIGAFIKKDTLPSFDSNNLNNLAQCKFTLIQPVNDSNIPYQLKNGDDICITDSLALESVFGDVCAGQIIKQSPKVITYIQDNDSNWIPYFEYEITIENREFSREYLIFKAEDTINSTFSDLLNRIFANTRQGLGGMLLSNNIQKYSCLVDSSITVPSFSFTGTNRECLTNLCQQMGLYWRIGYYVAPDNTNNISLIQQVVISQ